MVDVFFDLSKKDRNLEIYLKDPVNIEKLKENVPNINLDSLAGVVKSSIQDKPKPKFDSNF